MGTNLKYDFIVKLQKQGEYERTFIFKAKQEYVDDLHFMAFINDIQPALKKHRAAKAENHRQFDPV